MRKEDRRQAECSSIDDKVREVFRVSDEQLAEEYDRIAAGRTPDASDSVPDGEFERIIERVEISAAARETDKVSKKAANLRLNARIPGLKRILEKAGQAGEPGDAGLHVMSEGAKGESEAEKSGFAMTEAEGGMPEKGIRRTNASGIFKSCGAGKKRSAESGGGSTIWRWGIAALAVFLVSSVLTFRTGGIWVSAGRLYKYTVQKQGEHESIFDNVDNGKREDILEKAYDKIRDELGIHVLELGYVPDGLICEACDINKHGFAWITFFYNQRYAYFFQTVGRMDNSAGYIADREPYTQIYNPFLERDIAVYRNELDNGEYEFGISFTDEKYFYFLEIQMEEEIFVKLVENLKFHE